MTGGGAGTSTLGFAAELATFLVSVAGMAAAFQHDVLSSARRARPLLVAGFGLLAAAAFLRGTLADPDPRSVALSALWGAGAVLLLAGVPSWRGRWSRVVLVASIGVGAVGVSARWSDRLVLGDVLLLVGAVGLAVVLIGGARRSIAARFSVLSALLVLAVVLAVSVTVSVVLSGNVADEAAGRYAARATDEAEAMAVAARNGLGSARIVAGVLASERAGALDRLGGADVDPSPEDLAALDQALVELTDAQLLDLREPVVLLTASGRPLAAVPSSLPAATRVAVAGDAVVAAARAGSAERQGVTVVGDRAFALSVAPVVARPAGQPQRTVGFVVVARQLDDEYLSLLGAGGEDLSFAIWSGTRPVARAGSLAVTVVDAGDVAGAMSAGARRSVRDGDAFAAVAPVDGPDGRPVMAVVVAAPGDAAASTQRSLFQALFVVALVGAFVTVLVASWSGERIGRRVRLLTDAARSLQDGDLDTTVDVGSGDELGVLGRTFTDMAGSLSTMTDELRSVAADEAALRARLQAVISGMNEALVAVDPTGEVIEINVAAEELLDIDRGEAVGLPVSTLVRWRLIDGTEEPLAEGDLPDGQPMAADLAAGDGRVPVIVTAAALLDEAGADAGQVLVFRDVRHEREVEDLKSSILANISHELRTPLTPIKGYAGMLRDRPVDRDRTRSMAEQIVAGVDQLERVVRQLVTFSTLNAGTLQPAPVPVGVAFLAEALEARWAGRVPSTHELRIAVGDGKTGRDGDDGRDGGDGRDGDDGRDGRGGEAEAGGVNVIVDPELLGQAVDELVDNAVKYAPEGGQVDVRFGVDDGWLRIDVADEGVGIEAEVVERIADAFVQADGSATRRFGGLGLGLACADRIVRAHGGRLAYETGGQRGTIVSILVPVAAPRR